MTTLKFSREGAADVEAAFDRLIIAGWTGRDAAAVQHHIEELQALGVPPPSTTPVYYRVAANNLTQATTFEALGHDSSGEAEPVLVSLEDGLWLGLGSDHTDRKAESISVALSKQLCGKPIGPRLWRFDDVAERYDDLVLRSWATIDGKRVLYQEGGLSGLRHPRELMALFLGREKIAGDRLPVGWAMFCGTLGAIGGVRPSSRFEMELSDPKTGRNLTHAYDVRVLPSVS